MSSRPIIREPGPFEARQLRPGDRYELHDGHAIYCTPTGGDGARATLIGAQVIDSDPNVEDAAIDAGFTTAPGMLRAPDISVGVPNKPGWVQGVPPLAVEYASRGQDEEALATRISDLLQAGTQQVWVVRLVGPRHVEVHRADQPVRIVSGHDLLEAPGILKKPVQAAMLYDRELAYERILENHLERRGYESLDAVRDEGRERGLEEGRERGRDEAARQILGELLRQRFGPLPPEAERRLAEAHHPELLRLTSKVLSAPSLEAVFEV
jgi:Uma2 family endonuclease